MPLGEVVRPGPLSPAEAGFGSMAVDVDVLRTLFLRPADWIHRRVESVVMHPDGVTRRNVSVDVDLSAHDPWPTDSAGRLLVPLSIQSKQPLRNFDAVCAGEPAPVLTTEDNGTLGELLLRGLVPEQLPLAEAGALAEEHIPALVRAPELRVEEVLARFRAHCEHLRTVVDELIERERLSPEDAENWDADLALFTAVADQLARGFLLTFVLPATLAGQRLVLKYAMDEQYAAGRRPRLGDRLRHCWMPWVGQVGLHDLPACRSFHAEVTVPPEVRLHEFTALPPHTPAPPLTGGSSAAATRVLAEDRAVRRWAGAVRGHLVLRSTSRFDDAFCEMVILPSPQGITAFASVAVSAITVLLLLLGAASLVPPGVLIEERGTAATAASLMMSVVAVLLSWINRQPEHDVSVRVMRPLRYALNLEAIVLLLLAGAASVPFMAAAAAGYWSLLVLLHAVSLLLVTRTWHVRRQVRRRRFAPHARRRSR